MLLKRDPVTLRQYGAYTIDGATRARVRGAAADTAITVQVTPATWKQLQILPEGLRSMEVLSIISTVEVRAVNEYDGVPGDDLIYNGNTYAIHAPQRHPRLLGIPENWTALAVRRQPLAVT